MKYKYTALVTFFIMILNGCSKDENIQFNYDIKILLGTWRITAIESNGNYINVIDYPGSAVFKATYATFNSNGNYSGRGEFGNGVGTYTAIGNSITTFVDNKEYMKYDIISLSGTDCELKMFGTNNINGIKIKCRKE